MGAAGAEEDAAGELKRRIRLEVGAGRWFRVRKSQCRLEVQR